MVRHRFGLVFFTVLTVVAVSSTVWSHGGGLDAQGGHYDRKNGGYHFHRGPRAGQYFSSKPTASAPTSESVGSTISGALANTESNDRIEVLVALLEKKGILEPGEYAKAMRDVQDK